MPEPSSFASCSVIPSLNLLPLRPTPMPASRCPPVYPSFAGVSDLVFTTHDAPELKSCDAVFLAVPHTAAMAQVPALLAAGVSCFDLSADYRLIDASVFEAWYAAEHTSPELLKTRAFGLPELFCQDLETAASSHAAGKPVLVACAGLLSHRNEPCCRSCRACGLGCRERPRNRRCH